MQSQALATIIVALVATAIPVYAANPDDKVITEQSISALELRITQAQPREQCYLYAELLHDMTEFSLKQYAAGDVDKANTLLRRVQAIARKIHLTVGDNDKRLKNAEILLRHSAFRLNEMLHNSSSEDRPLVAETLAQVNRCEDEAMLTVFRK